MDKYHMSKLDQSECGCGCSNNLRPGEAMGYFVNSELARFRNIPLPLIFLDSSHVFSGGLDKIKKEYGFSHGRFEAIELV